MYVCIYIYIHIYIYIYVYLSLSLSLYIYIYIYTTINEVVCGRSSKTNEYVSIKLAKGDMMWSRPSTRNYQNTQYITIHKQ